MTASETMVRMGELAASSASGDVLIALGLGSCIGLALVDRRLGIAGLAHIVLPAAPDDAQASPRKFADHAVPALIAELEILGARKVRLEAVLVGGAAMFAASTGALDVGQRNETAVRELLTGLRIPVLAAATGGNRGRTIRVNVADMSVTVREAGGKHTELLTQTRQLETV